MKKSFALASVVCNGMLLVGCSSIGTESQPQQPKQQSQQPLPPSLNQTQSVNTVQPITDVQTIDTKDYTIAVPKDWTVSIDLGVSFKKSGKNIGGLEIESYNPPDSVFYPNHSEIIEKKTLDGFFTTVIKVTFNRTQPAASLDTSVTKEAWFYFLIVDKNDKNIAYVLHFNQDDVDDQTMMDIAKSLKLKGTNTAK